MKNLFLVTGEEQLRVFQTFVSQHKETIKQFISHIKEEYQVETLPSCFLWSDSWTAQHILRDCPLPAYTNDDRIVFNPEKAVWQALYLKQLDYYAPSFALEELRQSYNDFSDNHVLQIIGHELLHHSEYFLDDWQEILWFEEGMVEYISRKYFLSADEYQEEKKRNQQLVQLFEQTFDVLPLHQFGQSISSATVATIFYDYWRSFLLIDQLVEDFGSIKAVFQSYHEWDRKGRPCRLEKWFD